MRKLRVHFLVESDSAPAPHMTGGVRETPVGRLGTGKPHVAACNKDVVLSEWDNGTNVPYAVACTDCMKTEAWQEAYKANPHPRDAGRPDAAEDVEAIKKGCC